MHILRAVCSVTLFVGNGEFRNLFWLKGKNESRIKTKIIL